MENILILIGIAGIAGLVTAILIWLDGKPKTRHYSLDSAAIIRALGGKP